MPNILTGTENRDTLQQSQLLLGSIIHNAMDAILAMDEEQRILIFNPAAEKMFQRSADETKGQFLSLLIPQRFRAQHEEDVRTYVQSFRAYKPGISFGLRANGEEFPLEASISQIENNGRKIFTAILRDITERVRREQDLSASEERLRSLFENTPISIWEEDFSAVKSYLDDLKNRGKDLESHLADHTEEVYTCAGLVKIIDMNRATLKLHDAPNKTELVNNLEKIFTPDAYEAFRQELLAIGNGRHQTSLNTIMQTLNGQRLEVSVSYTTVPGYEKTLSRVLVSVVDLTERKQAEANLQRSLENTERSRRLLLALSQAGNTIQRVDTSEEICEAILGQLSELGYRGAILLTLPGDSTHLEVSYISHPKNTMKAIEKMTRVVAKGFRLPIPPGSFMERVLETGETTFSTADLSLYENILPAYLRPFAGKIQMAFGIKNGITARLTRGNKAYGLLSVAGDDLTEADIPAMASFASQASIALENVQLLETVRRKEKHFRSLIEQLPAVTYLDEVNHAASPGDFVTTFVSPQVEMLLGYPAENFTADPRLWNQLIHPEDREGVVKRNAEHYVTRQPNRDEYRMLTRGDDVIWVRDDSIILPSENGRGVISQGVVFDITERKQHEHELEVIAAFSYKLRTAATQAEMLPVILDQLLDLVKADGVAISMIDPTTGDAVYELGRGGLSRLSDMHIPQNIGMTGLVIATRQPFVSQDIQRDPRFVRPDLLGEIRAVVCLPLIAEGQVIGALLAGWNTRIREQEIPLLTSMTDIAAIALHRVRLHEQTLNQLERLAALRVIDMSIMSTFDLKLTLNVLVEKLMGQLGIDAADVLLLKQGDSLLEFGAGQGFLTSGIRTTSLRLGEDLAGHSAVKRETLHSEDLNTAGMIDNRPWLATEEKFVSTYAVPLVAKNKAVGVLEIFHRSGLSRDKEWVEFLEALGGQAAIAIDNATLFNELQLSNLELQQAYDKTIEGWSRALDLRDKETEGHTKRVTELAVQLAQQMGIDGEQLTHIRRGALLHDIGKMGVPDNILLKPGGLNNHELKIMQLHPQLAYDMLVPIDYLRPALDIPYCHHEKWDGTGYPRGLKGEDIPLTARIFAVVDVWDALLHDRPYRLAWKSEDVLRYIREQSGKHFDPQVVRAFLDAVTT